MEQETDQLVADGENRGKRGILEPLLGINMTSENDNREILICSNIDEAIIKAGGTSKF
jgi:hypothetical protein